MTTSSGVEYSLPLLTRIPEGIRQGRNVREGYARAWGLQFGGLREKIVNDPLYQEAVEVSHRRSVQSEGNRLNIYLLLKFFIGKLAPGHICEFGSYKGGSAIFMAKVCSVLHPAVRVYAFDTFAGMPRTDATIDAHAAGDFRDVDLPKLRDYASELGLDNIEFVEGRFEDTVPAKLPSIGAIRLSHVDCDMREAVAYAYERSVPYMVEGGYIAFDDALFSSCLGATEAVEDLVIRRDGRNSEQIYPQFVFRVGL